MPNIEKTAEEIESVLEKIDTHNTKYPAMSYEQGIEFALQWVLGEIADEELDDEFKV
jgi:hypothetical protein